MAAQRLGKRVLSKLQGPARARGAGGSHSPGGLQKRHARVTVKYDRRELQRRLDVEKWIDGRLEELYQGRVRRLGGPESPARAGPLGGAGLHARYRGDLRVQLAGRQRWGAPVATSGERDGGEGCFLMPDILWRLKRQSTEIEVERQRE